jgi:Tol biopolymer transport system component
MKGGDIWVVNRNGRGARDLTRSGGDSHPSWSPDGSRIAFDRTGVYPQHSEDVWVMNADGSNAVNVTAGLSDGSGFSEPTWSPDGTRFAIRRYPDCYGGGLITLNVDGSDESSVFCMYDAQNSSWQALP